MALTKLVNGVRIELTSQEEAALRAQWAANKIEHDAETAEINALNTQISSEKTNLPTWLQVETAIDAAFTNNAQANIIKKIARPVYTYLKKTID